LKVIRWLVHFLGNFAQGSKLRDISVSVAGVLETHSNKIWGQLNALVTEQSVFPALSRVKVLFDDDIGLVEEMRAVVPFNLCLLSERFELTSPAIEESVDQNQ
jgi:hypothetical protein